MQFVAIIAIRSRIVPKKSSIAKSKRNPGLLSDQNTRTWRNTSIASIKFFRRLIRFDCKSECFCRAKGSVLNVVCPKICCLSSFRRDRKSVVQGKSVDVGGQVPTTLDKESTDT